MNADIERAKEIIVNEYHPDKIILFGSHARGDNGPESVIDIIVISDREKGIPKPKRGLQLRIRLGAIRTPLDILFYTKEEFAKHQGVSQSLSATISREGQVLY